MTEFTVGDTVRFNTNKEGFIVPGSYGTVVEVSEKQVFVRFNPDSVWHCNKKDLEIMKYDLGAMGFVPDSTDVMDAFLWEKTPEGFGYWAKFSCGKMSEEEEQEAYNKWDAMKEQWYKESSIIKNTKTENLVEHPSHYNQDGSIECIDAIKASLGKDGFIDYCKGNCLKYLWRYKHKSGVEDLKKAKVYLTWMIEELDEC